MNFRIPDPYFNGGFGQKVARPAGGVPSLDRSGELVGEAVQRLGQQGQAIAGEMMEQEGRVALSRANELKQQADEAERERKALEKSKQKGEATLALVQHENALLDVAESLAKDKSLSADDRRQQFGTKSDEVRQAMLKSVPEEYQPVFAPSFEEHRYKAQRHLETALGTEAREKTKGQLFETLEALERSPKPLAEKLTIMRDIPEEIWTAAGMGPDDRAKQLQLAGEKMTRGTIDQKFNQEPLPKVLQQLQATDEAGNPVNFPDLDPSARQAYVHTAKSRIEEEERRRQAEIRHLAAERNRIARDALDEFKEARNGLTPITPQREAELRRQVAGTDYAKRFRQVDKATGGIDFQAKKIRQDPLTFGAAAMGLEVPPLAANNPQAWAGQLEQRGAVAQQVKQKHGLSYLPILTNSEAKEVAGYLKEQAPAAMIKTAAALQQGFGRDSLQRIAGQFAQHDTEMGMVVGLVSQDKGDAAFHVANGMKLLDGGGPERKPAIKLPERMGKELEARFSGNLGGALLTMPQQRAAFSQAVRSAYVSKVVGKYGEVGEALDKKLYDDAYHQVVGESVKINGKETLLPAGMTGQGFKTFFRNIGPDAVKRAGGVFGMGSDEKAARAIVDDAKLYETGGGRYRVAIDGKYLMTADQKKYFEIELGSHEGAE